MTNPPTLMSEEKATSIAFTNNKTESEGWSYKVQPIGNRFAVAVSSEAGFEGYL